MVETKLTQQEAKEKVQELQAEYNQKKVEVNELKDKYREKESECYRLLQTIHDYSMALQASYINDLGQRLKEYETQQSNTASNNTTPNTNSSRVSVQNGQKTQNVQKTQMPNGSDVNNFVKQELGNLNNSQKRSDNVSN